MKSSVKQDDLQCFNRTLSTETGFCVSGLLTEVNGCSLLIKFRQIQSKMNNFVTIGFRHFISFSSKRIPLEPSSNST